ncbi:MAG: ABC transporter ATP-binding protein [Thermostichales cyanobacterium SZTDM-1c_bins_54]
MTAAITVEHLQKRYGNTIALQDVSFEVQPGEIFGLLGPNGAGKTTTLQCLCTLQQPDQGRLEIFGIPVTRYPQQVRQKLGYVGQEMAIDKVLTGRELLQLQADLYHLPPALAKARIEQVLELLGLQDRADQRCGTYSGGLRKRLDLAAGLLHQPQILVLDEPTVGLDIEARSAIWSFLRQLKQQGITILLTSHYLEEVDLLSDRVAIIDQGRVIASGSPAALKQQVGGDRVTVRLQEFTPEALATQAVAVLGQLPFVHKVVVNPAQGNALNLVVKAGADLAAVQTCLQQAGLPLFSLAQSRPSLDDVYLAATGKTLLDAELAAAEANATRKGKKR